MIAPVPGRPWGALIALACACLAPGAAAASEGENAASASLSYARYSLGDEDQSASGAALGLDYERGVTDRLWLRGSGGFGYYPGDSSYSGHATAGLTYAFDVLKYVPYANAGVGGIVVAGGPVDADIHPLVEIGAGLDVLHSRSWSYGVQVRLEAYVDETALFTAGARATYRWGFF